MNRRKLLHRAAAIPVAALGAKALWHGGGPAAAAAPTEKVSEDNATAQALSYVHDAEASPKRATAEQKKQFCYNCLHYDKTVGGEKGWGACAVLPGYLVAGKGWCMVWVAEPA